MVRADVWGKSNHGRQFLFKSVQVLCRNQNGDVGDPCNTIWMFYTFGGDLETPLLAHARLEVSHRLPRVQTVIRTLHSLGVMSPQKKGKDPFFAAPSTLDVGSGPVISHLRTLPVTVCLPPGTSVRYLTPLPSSRARELIISEIVGDVPRKA